jgi:hypothetical protein
MTKDIQHSFSQDKMHIVMRNTDCPNCEYHRQRAQNWREEAYKQAGYPLPEREWVTLTYEEQRELYKKHEMDGWGHFYNAIEAKLKEKNS